MNRFFRVVLLLTIAFLGFFVSTLNALEISYTYDATNRIVSAAYGEGVDTTSFNYQYDAAGNIVKFSISCPSPCPQCSSHPVNLTNTTFPSGTLCECADETSITIGAGVTIEKGASVIFKAPKVYVKSGAKIVEGANVLIRQN